MKALNTLWSEIRRSLTDFSFYPKAARSGLRSAMRYVYWLSFFLALFAGIITAAKLAVSMPLVREFIAHVQTEAPLLYPKELVVTIKNGELSTNAKGPVTIQIPSRWQKAVGTGTSLMIIDPTAKAEDYRKLHTMLLVTQRGIVYPRKSETRTVNGTKTAVPSEIGLYTFDDVQQFEMDKERYDALVTKAVPYLDWVPSILTIGAIALVIILPFIAAGAVLLGYLIYLLVLTIFTWVISRIVGTQWTYAQLYTMSMYGLTLPMLLEFLRSQLSLNAPFPLLFSLIFLVWMTIILVQSKPMTAVPRRQS